MNKDLLRSLVAKLSSDPLLAKSIYIHIIATLSTGILMWSYAICAALTISSPIPAIVGIICSVIHLASPLLFSLTDNLVGVTLIMLIPGVIHQSSFAFFTGGFKSHILIWFGIIPLLAGIIEGRKSTLATTALVTTIAFVFLLLELAGFKFPDLISQEGEMFAQALLVFGYIAISSIVVFQYVGVTSRHSKSLEDQKDKTGRLLQILLHDMSNRIQLISLNNSALKRKITAEPALKNVKEIDNSLTGLGDIMASVRSMHLVDIQKKSLHLGPHNLNDVIKNSVNTFSDQLRINDQEIVFKEIEAEVLCDPLVLQNQVLNNLLSNAIKFSPSNSKIHISEASTQSHVVITIKDQGIGIPAPILSNLFNYSYDTTRLGARDEKGSGLGMIIAKSMVERMRGELKVESSTEVSKSGTSFAIKLIKAM
ncbi:MAG: hypothetical protein CME67_01700 [Halobacteriovoraceae bacterium]|nr:hypothetical protein [Halobacteriovoraceae bacterium]